MGNALEWFKHLTEGFTKIDEQIAEVKQVIRSRCKECNHQLKDTKCVNFSCKLNKSR